MTVPYVIVSYENDPWGRPDEKWHHVALYCPYCGANSIWASYETIMANGEEGEQQACVKCGRMWLLIPDDECHPDNKHVLNTIREAICNV